MNWVSVAWVSLLALSAALATEPLSPEVEALDVHRLLSVVSCSGDETRGHLWVIRIRARSCALDDPGGSCSPTASPTSERLAHSLQRQDDLFRAVAVQAAEDLGGDILRFGDVVVDSDSVILQTVLQSFGVSFLPSSYSSLDEAPSPAGSRNPLADAVALDLKVEERRQAQYHAMRYLLVGPFAATNSALFRQSNLPFPPLLQALARARLATRAGRRNSSSASTLESVLDAAQRGQTVRWVGDAGPHTCHAQPLSLVIDPLDEHLLVLARRRLAREPYVGKTSSWEALPQAYRALMLRRAVLLAIFEHLPHLLPVVRNVHGVAAVAPHPVAVECDSVTCLQHALLRGGAWSPIATRFRSSALRPRRVMIASFDAAASSAAMERVAWALWALAALPPYSHRIRIVYTLRPDTPLAEAVFGTQRRSNETLLRLAVLPLLDSVPELPNHVELQSPKAVVDVSAAGQLRAVLDRYSPRDHGQRHEGGRHDDDELWIDKKRQALASHMSAPLRHLPSPAQWVSHVVEVTHAVTAVFVLPARRNAAWHAAATAAAMLQPIRARLKLNVFYVTHGPEALASRRAPTTFDEHVVDLLTATCNISSWPAMIIFSPGSSSQQALKQKKGSSRSLTRRSSAVETKKHILVFEGSGGKKQHASKAFVAENLVRAIRGASEAIQRATSGVKKSSSDGQLRYVGMISNAKLQAAVQSSPRDLDTESRGFSNVEEWFPLPSALDRDTHAETWGAARELPETNTTLRSEGKGKRETSGQSSSRDASEKTKKRAARRVPSATSEVHDGGGVPEPMRQRPRRHSPIVSLDVGWDALRVGARRGGDKQVNSQPQLAKTRLLCHPLSGTDGQAVWIEDA
jgi:hypothetical protein